MAGFADPLQLLRCEIQQRVDEGCVIPSELRRTIEAIDVQDRWHQEVVLPLWDRVMALPWDEHLAAREPNDLLAIRALRPDGPRDLGWDPSEDEAIDRFHGAWTGRAVGCALGKPVEGMGLGVSDGGPIELGREKIRRHLQARHEWPLDDYFTDEDGTSGLALGSPRSHRENIAFMEPDDDINYSLVGLGLVEEHGPHFCWEDVANYWTDHIPYGFIATAETQAILNYWTLTSRFFWSFPDRRPPRDTAATPAYTRRHRNPYREWIGAQIRGDGLAWCAAGKPELAAEFAHRDASWTHERNGIYGEMFFAAMQAAAFIESDWRRLVEIGLSEIPAECRLALAVRKLVDWISGSDDWEATMARVEAEYRATDPHHVIPNALICIVGMAYGTMKPHDSICLAVSAGLDTDCNGATVGSIVGAVHGRRNFESPLAGRLNDTIKSTLAGVESVTMIELARRTWTQWRRVHDWHSGGRL